MSVEAAAVLRLAEAIEAARATAMAERWSLDVSVPATFTVALVGPAGGGKSTLAESVLGLRPPTHLGGIRVPVEYRYGERPGVQATLLDEWGDTARRLEFTPALIGRTGLSRVVVSGPFPALRAWHLRVVDYPSVATVGDLATPPYAGLDQADLGVLYVTHTRGRTDTDVLAIERLRQRPLIAVESIRSAELTPARSLFEPIGVGASAYGEAVQILPFAAGPDRADVAPLARRLLQLCIALLRATEVGEEALAELGQDIVAELASLRGSLADRLTAVRAAAKGNLTHRLHATASLLALHADTRRLTSLDDRLTAAARLAEQARMQPAHALRVLLDTEMRAALRRYNIMAGTSGRRGDKPTAAPTTDAPPLADEAPAAVGDRSGFGTGYAKHRLDLLGLLDTLRSSGLPLHGKEQEQLANIHDDVTDDRIALAMLGRFSSGKSSIINALLDLPINDRESPLLPTAVRVETATINRVEYADRNNADHIDWLPSTTLTFLSPADEAGALKNAKKVHVQEIDAFQHWLEHGEVRPEDCDFMIERVLPGEIVAPPSDMDGNLEIGRNAFARMIGYRRRLGAKSFVYLMDDADRGDIVLEPGIICREVRVRRFAHAKPRTWPGRLPVRQAFELSRRPEYALRLKQLHIGFPHPMLRHVTFIDTPGTDAPIPHHREEARGAIKDRACPVVYCFNGHMAGGHEDEENLRSIWDASGSVDLKRFFFVITRAGEFSRNGQKEIVQSVHSVLSKLKIRGVRLYFTEVVTDRNEDFLSLVKDVNAFISGDRRPELLRWAERARLVLDAVATRMERQLANQTARADELERQRTQLRTTLDGIVALRTQLDTSDEWGAARANRRIDDAIDDPRDEVGRHIRGLTDKGSFKGIESRLEKAIDELNRAARTAVIRNCEAVGSALRMKVAESVPGRDLDTSAPSMSGSAYPAAGVLEAARNVTWRGVWAKVKGWWNDDTKFSQDVPDNRNRVSNAWDSSRASGDRTVSATVTAWLSNLRRQVDLVVADLEERLRTTAILDPVELDQLRHHRDDARRWAARLSQLVSSIRDGGTS